MMIWTQLSFIMISINLEKYSFSITPPFFLSSTSSTPIIRNSIYSEVQLDRAKWISRSSTNISELLWWSAVRLSTKPNIIRRIIECVRKMISRGYWKNRNRRSMLMIICVLMIVRNWKINWYWKMAILGH